MISRDTRHIKLERCPHCNSEAFLAWYGGGYYKARCNSGKCAAVGGSAKDPQVAADLWNKRVNTEDKEFLDYLEEILDVTFDRGGYY